MINEGDASNIENGETVAATMEQSTIINLDDTQVNREIVSTTPKEVIPNTQTEQTIVDSQVSSTKEVTYKKQTNH